MNVTDAVKRRMSARAFRPDPIAADTVRDLLETAARSPSGGNVQPWNVHALTGEPLAELLALVREQGPDAAPGYQIYPDNLWEPHRSRRYQIGEAMYNTLGIAREDKKGRLTQMARNAELFGAPVGMFVFVDRRMGSPQWSDLGMYLQTLMLLAVERGFDTCAQEYWALYSSKVERFFGVPEEQMLFCAVALGKRDETAPINTLVAPRAPFDEWASLRGF